MVIWSFDRVILSAAIDRGFQPTQFQGYKRKQLYTTDFIDTLNFETASF